MRFSAIIGQNAAKQRLITSVENNRISHAQLFLGPEGCGKLALAIAYAQYISCENRTANDSCGQCSSCSKYEKLIHPDLHFVFPVIKSPKFKNPISDNFLAEWRSFILGSSFHRYNDWLNNLDAANKQGGIFAHESAEIIRKLNFKTYEAEYKIMIIWLPEKMNVVAANKLLKMIEEPPPKTLFLLVGASTEDLLVTILSRTQLIKIPKLSDEAVGKAIQQEFKVSDEELSYIVRSANGDYIKAKECVNESAEAAGNFELFTRIMRLCYGYKVIDAMEWVEELAKNGREKQKNFLSYGLRMLRENFVMNQAENQSKEINYLTKKEREFSKKFSKFINERNIFQLSYEFNRAHYHIERNANNKLVLFDLSLNMMKLLRK
ncbi:MAG: DNA polymerase III subunit delta [Bacteroidia bacterium]|nr:MAG: DNA polymerase III subunit delta [Bacteroidia bacterium]